MKHKPWFQKSRESDVDREIKFQFITAINTSDKRFWGKGCSGMEHDKLMLQSPSDSGVACDLCLDLLRYYENVILDPLKVKAQYDSSVGGVYTKDTFVEQVKLSMKPVVYDIFAIIEGCYQLQGDSYLD